MMALLSVPFFLQGLLMVVDEFYFHRKRGLPKWERVGHPLDTLTVLFCFGLLFFLEPTLSNIWIYATASGFSCLFVTKDEFIHRDLCEPAEMWLHSVLFVLHPIVFGVAGLIWFQNLSSEILWMQFILIFGFLLYQTAYWNFFAAKISAEINTRIYDELGERWYHAQDDPVALLRAESKIVVPWVVERLAQNATILDIGCGGGFISNPLAMAGKRVTGIDVSEESLAIARKYDSTKSVEFLKADAYKLPFPDASFDAITCMDMLEHVDNPVQVIQEASRVLKPGGLFFYHTFNRTFLSWLLAIKLVEFLVRNTPKHLHLWRMFITLKEFNSYLKLAQLQNLEIKGLEPEWGQIRLKDLLSGSVPKNFSFRLTDNKKVSYLGYARKD